MFGPRPLIFATLLALTGAAAFLFGATPRKSKSADAPAPPPEEVRVVHYNLKNYLAMPRRVDGEVRDDAPKPESEKSALVKILAGVKPDILGVCEIGSEKDVIDLQERLEKAGVELGHRFVVEGADPVRHLALLSRFPIVADHSEKSLTYQIDDKTLPFERGVLDVTIEVNSGYRLRLVGNHLKSRREVPEADQTLMRRNEAHLLRQHLEKILTDEPETNLLVYGDFNDTKNEAPVKVIQGHFGEKTYLRDLPLEDDDGLRWTYYWSLADKYERIDFAFASNGLIPEIRLDHSRIAKDPAWEKASDHRPLVISLTPRDEPRRR